MTTPTNDVPLSQTPGKDAWNRSARIERLMLKLRDVAVRATYRTNAALATPAEFEMWAKDLRRGRLNPIGGFKRFVDLIESRHMGETGRQLALEVWALAGEYLDIALPDTAEKAEPENKYVVDISSETPKARVARVVKYGRSA